MGISGDEEAERSGQGRNAMNVTYCFPLSFLLFMMTSCDPHYVADGGISVNSLPPNVEQLDSDLSSRGESWYDTHDRDPASVQNRK